MTDITPGACPHCGVINRETKTFLGRDGGPEEGDILICESCTGLAIYIGHGAGRKPTEYELEGLMEDPDIIQGIFQAQIERMQ